MPDLSSVPQAVADTPSSPSGDGAVQVTSDGRFRTGGGTAEWRCPICDTWNDLGHPQCSVCGAYLPASQSDEPPPPQHPPAVLIALTALIPGSGHVAAGRTATGIARGAMYLLWLIGGTVLVSEAVQAGQAPLPGILLLLGALAILVASVIDIRILAAGGRQQLLDGRTFLWLVVGVVWLLMLTFMATAARLGQG